jgi:hypothetical protein
MLNNAAGNKKGNGSTTAAKHNGKKLNSILNRTLSDSILYKKSFSAASFNNTFYLNQRRDFALSRKNRFFNFIILFAFPDFK